MSSFLLLEKVRHIELFVKYRYFIKGQFWLEMYTFPNTIRYFKAGFTLTGLVPKSNQSEASLSLFQIAFLKCKTQTVQDFVTKVMWRKYC